MPVLVRPEDLRVGEPGADAATMTVVRRMFLGDHVRLHLEAQDTRLIADVDRDHAAVPGAVVGVRVPDIAWIPGDGDASTGALE
jgi:ABC-type Fe3+/spermidine/putrescine transport system ATPase subunit